MKFRFPTFCYAAVSFCMIVLAGGCKEDTLNEGTPLTLSYATNTLTIAPDGDDYVIPAPEYEGYAPYRFAFTSITLDGSSYSDDTHFSIAADNGKITVTNTSTLEVGTYLLSVSCESNAVHYEWPDAVRVEVIKLIGDVVAVNIVAPEVSMKDDLLTAEGDFLVAEASFTEAREGAVLSIAHVINDRDEAHAIAWFRLSEDNRLYFRHETASEVEAGIYTVSLKVTDANGDEGIVPSFDITVTAEPYSLVYEPAVLETQERGSKVEATASVKGNPNGLSFEFGSVLKKSGEENLPAEESLIGKLFTIGQENGTVAVDPAAMTGSDSYAGEYIFNILVKNADSEDGVLFENVLSAVILEYQEPISGFSYNTATVAIGKTAVIEKEEGFVGGSPVFTFAEGTDQKYLDAIELDPATGTLTFREGNSLAGGSHSVTIVAKNNSGSVEATFEFVVIDPTTFSYFTYGSNYVEAGSPEEAIAGKHTSHFRYSENGEYTLPLPTGDFYPGTLKWSVKNILKVSTSSIDEKTGELTVTTDCSASSQIACVLVTATLGEKSVTSPVFFNVPLELSGPMYTVTYSPFVARINPAKSGVVYIPAPAVSPEPAQFKSDFRTGFNYVNWEGTYDDGTPLESGALANSDPDNSLLNNPLKYLWVYTENNGKLGGSNGCNFGSKSGMSEEGVTDQSIIGRMAAYISQSDNRIVINSQNWVIRPFGKTITMGKGVNVDYTNDRSGTFDGLFYCTSVFDDIKNGKDPYRAVTNCIWIDKDYEPEN